jgi:hypothetical protein
MADEPSASDVTAMVARADSYHGCVIDDPEWCSMVLRLAAAWDRQAARIAAYQQQVLGLTDVTQALEHDYAHAKARIVAWQEHLLRVHHIACDFGLPPLDSPEMAE